MKSKVTLKKLSPQVYCIVVSNLRLLTQTFVRLQEFYESPFKEIRGQHFTLNQFKKLYSQDRDGFTYYEDWAGFNIPGHIVINFFKIFKDLSPKEVRVRNLLKDALASEDRFYVIGIPKLKNKEVINHELSHALFYTIPSFRKQMIKVALRMPNSVKRNVFRKLKEMGYSNSVKIDEFQAYMATGNLSNLRYFFGTNIKTCHVAPFRNVFHRFKML